MLCFTAILKFVNITKEWITDHRVTGKQHMLNHREQHYSLFAYNAIYFSISVQRLTEKWRFRIFRMMKSFGMLSYVIEQTVRHVSEVHTAYIFKGKQSKKTVWLWRRRQYDPSKRQRLFIPRHSIVLRRLQIDTQIIIRVFRRSLLKLLHIHDLVRFCKQGVVAAYHVV